jgi:hypothetical protein
MDLASITVPKEAVSALLDGVVALPPVPKKISCCLEIVSD